jgi:hypothetical protein
VNRRKFLAAVGAVAVGSAAIARVLPERKWKDTFCPKHSRPISDTLIAAWDPASGKDEIVICLHRWESKVIVSPELLGDVNLRG